LNDHMLSKMLFARKAIVIHFSHHANMRKDGVFPRDLQEAIEHKDEWPLSCSVLWPGHSIDPCGSVGVIFEPDVASVISVSNMDAGSWTELDGTDQSDGEPLTAESFNKTFDVVGAYNEWRIRGAKVAGIFVHDVKSIMVKKMLDISGLPDGIILQEIGFVTIQISEVFEAFPYLPVFTMTKTELIRLNKT
jgi:hypothetical protein